MRLTKPKVWLTVEALACLVGAFAITVPEWETWRPLHMVLLPLNFGTFCIWWDMYLKEGD